MTLTNAELAILSLVTETPRHGYEIEQVIEGRGMRDWTEVGFSSIYYLLKKLERQGLIEGHLQETELGPARKVYKATPEGIESLRAAVLDALSVPRRCYPPFQLGLANLPTIPPVEAVAALQRYRDALAVRRPLDRGGRLLRARRRRRQGRARVRCRRKLGPAHVRIRGRAREHLQGRPRQRRPGSPASPPGT